MLLLLNPWGNSGVVVTPPPPAATDQGAGVRLFPPSKQKLLALYEAWRAAKVKVKQLKPGPAKRALAKAVKEVAEVIETQPTDVVAIVDLTGLLEAAMGAAKLSQIAIEADLILAKALAMLADDEDDQIAHLLLAP